MKILFQIVVILGIFSICECNILGDSLPKEQSSINIRLEQNTNFVIRTYKNGDDTIHFGVLGKYASCQIKNMMIIPYAKGFKSNKRVYLFKDPNTGLIYFFKEKLMSVYTEKDEELEIIKKAFHIEYLSPNKNNVIFEFEFSLDEGYWEQ